MKPDWRDPDLPDGTVEILVVLAVAAGMLTILLHRLLH
jgi:hypothetical protein